MVVVGVRFKADRSAISGPKKIDLACSLRRARDKSPPKRSLEGAPRAQGAGLVWVSPVGKEFQGDMAAEFEVFRLIHDSHAPAADFAQDAVMGHHLPHGLGGRGHWLDMLGGGGGEGKSKVEGSGGVPAPRAAVVYK